MKATTRLLGIAIILASITMINACKGISGEVGPAGATGAKGDIGATGPAGSKGEIGATGAAGAAGANGQNGTTGAKGDKGDTGSFGAIQFTYPLRTHTGSSLIYTLTGITGDVINKSILLFYLANSAGNWYAIPGIFNGANEYRTIFSPITPSSSVTIVRVAGGIGGTDTFNATRIVIVPITDLRNGRKANLDYSDYEAVKAYYNLED